MKKPININYVCQYELSKGHESDAGIDLRILEDIIIQPGETLKINSGLSLEIPLGYYGFLTPRSSFGVTTGLYMHNGIIDNNYRGNISIVISNYNKKSWFKDNSIKLEKDSRIAQLIIQPYLSNINLIKTDKLTQTVRGINGFGSTGKK